MGNNFFNFITTTGRIKMKWIGLGRQGPIHSGALQLYIVTLDVCVQTYRSKFAGLFAIR